ncbi:MAG: hypothetical protein IPL20_01355 [Saprospiraceae bacterium]|nr:hypothetical protein [Saprospiraceae bacterium]
MKKILTVSMKDFKTGESLEFANNVDRVFASADTKTLMLEDQWSAFKTAAADLENVFIDSTGTEMTRELRLLDTERLIVLAAMKLLLKSLVKGGKDDIAAMAARLLNNFLQHCKSISKMGYQNKTALIRSMLKDWTTLPALMEASKVVFLRNEVEDLTEKNTLFAEKFFENAISNKRNADIPLKKAKLKEAYDTLIDITVSFSKVAADKQPYLNIIEELNKVIERNNMPVLLRRGLRKKSNPVIPTPVTVPDEMIF